MPTPIEITASGLGASVDGTLHSLSLTDGTTTYLLNVGSTRLIIAITPGGNEFAFINGPPWQFEPYNDLGADLGGSGNRWANIWLQRILRKLQVLVSGVAPAVDASAGDRVTLSILTNIAVVIAVPTAAPAAGHGQRLSFEIKNGSGGALTTPPAFNAGAGGFVVSSALPALANGQHYTIEFEYSQDAAKWVQVSVAPFVY